MDPDEANSWGLSTNHNPWSWAASSFLKSDLSGVSLSLPQNLSHKHLIDI